MTLANPRAVFSYSSLCLGPVIPVGGGEPTPQAEPNDTVQSFIQKSKINSMPFYIGKLFIIFATQTTEKKVQTFTEINLSHFIVRIIANI